MLENDTEISKLIRKLIPINELTEKIQNKVISNADLLEIKKGKYLFRKGDKDHFSYYLLSGEIDLVSDRQIHDTIKEGTDRSLYAMAQLQPRQFSAVAKKTAQVLKVNRTVLDKLLLVSKQSSDKKANLADTISGPGDLEVNEIDDDDDNLDWMSRLLQSELFMKIPSGNIQKLFGLLESDNYKAGQVVIEQGQEGEHYYVIQEGKCVVTRKAGASSNPIKLAQLKVGDSFGEESLLMDTKCNANVSMETDGVLMRLSKENFIELIKKPTLQTVSYDKAEELIKVGAEWLDVRFESEHNQSYIEGSQNIPLNLLRTQVKKLSTDTQYITYCDTGARSSAAAFLLTERGYKVLYLDGGLISQQDIPNLISNNEPEVETEEEAKVEAASVEVESEVSKTSESDNVASIAEKSISENKDSDKDFEALKEKYKKQLQSERTALQEKYTEAQRMLDKAKLIRQEAEKSREKLDADIEKRSSVIELSQQKVLKDLQSKVDDLEASKEKLEEKNKTLLSKRVELENELNSKKEELTNSKEEKESLEKKIEELTNSLKAANEEKLKALQDSLKVKQDAKRIIETYKEKHKMLYQMEEEIIQQELQTLDEESSQFSFDNVTQMDAASDVDEVEDKPQEASKLDDNSRSEMSEKLMQEISSQLGK